jgi:hypothetical protein
MAETFKNANISSVSNGAADTLYTAPAGATCIILGAAVANKTGNSVGITLTFNDTSSGVNSDLLSTVQIPANTTLEVFAGQKYVLETGDSLTALSDTASAVDITLSVLELT